MMKTVMYSVVSVMALLVSFYFGARVGVEQYVLAISSGNAYSLAREINIINGGKAEELVPELEAELKNELRLYERFVESGHPIILWPQLHDIDHDSYIRRLEGWGFYVGE